MEILEAAPPCWEDSYPLNNKPSVIVLRNTHSAGLARRSCGTAAAPRPDDKTFNPSLDKHTSSHSPQRPG